MPDQQLSKRAAAQKRIAEKRAAEAAAKAQAQRRRRAVTGGVIAAVVLVIALVVVIVVRTNQTSTSAQSATPANTVSNGQVVEVGSANAPLTIDLYFDYLCPNCKNFEGLHGQAMDQLVAQGKAKVRYHGMAFLDSPANDQFSTRALNAAAAVVNAAGPEAFQKFHELVYANQPPESGPGLDDSKLISFAAQAGATGSTVESQIKDESYGDWVKKITDQASKDGVTGTPTVKINGKPVADWVNGFDAAVQAAQGG